MSALAQIMFDKGFTVQGSDVEKYFFTQKVLEEDGIEILPFSEDNIHEGLTIIAGNAFKDEHPEIKKSDGHELASDSLPQVFRTIN